MGHAPKLPGYGMLDAAWGLGPGATEISEIKGNPWLAPGGDSHLNQQPRYTMLKCNDRQLRFHDHTKVEKEKRNCEPEAGSEVPPGSVSVCECPFYT